MLVAIVSRDPLISPEEWQSVAHSFGEVEPTPMREYKNPFKPGEKSIQGEPNAIRLVVEGECIGGMSGSIDFDTSGVIEVTSLNPDERLVDVVNRIVGRLGAEIEWIKGPAAAPWPSPP